MAAARINEKEIEVEGQKKKETLFCCNKAISFSSFAALPLLNMWIVCDENPDNFLIILINKSTWHINNIKMKAKPFRSLFHAKREKYPYDWKK